MCAYERYEAVQRQIETAIHLLEKGGLIAIPTDTLYGLAVHPFNEKAVRRVFQLKGRPNGMALPLLLSDSGDIQKYAKNIPTLTWDLVDRFWPGALTIVLRKDNVLPDIVTGGKGTVALRVPDHEVPRAIARELDSPITGTSANRSGKSGMMTAMEVRGEFDDKELDLVIDDVKIKEGVASTLLDLSKKDPRILRQGSITKEEIEEVCRHKVYSEFLR